MAATSAARQPIGPAAWLTGELAAARTSRLWGRGCTRCNESEKLTVDRPRPRLERDQVLHPPRAVTSSEPCPRRSAEELVSGSLVLKE